MAGKTANIFALILNYVINIQKASLVPVSVSNKILKFISLQYRASRTNTSVSGDLTTIVFASGSDVLLLIDSSAAGETHFTNLCFFRLTCIHSLSQNKHLSARNNALYLADDAAEEYLLLFEVLRSSLSVAVELILRFPAFERWKELTTPSVVPVYEYRYRFAFRFSGMFPDISWSLCFTSENVSFFSAAVVLLKASYIAGVIASHHENTPILYWPP